MAKQKWGKTTRIKYLGGELTINLFADKKEDEYVKQLDGIARRSMDLRPAHTAAANYIRGSVARNFEAEGRPSKWASLQQSTIQDRARQGYAPGPILQRTGKLKASLTQEGAPGSLMKVTPKTLQYGSNIPYFPIHQHGAPGANIPQRVMVILQRQDRSQLSRIYNRYIKEGK